MDYEQLLAKARKELPEDTTSAERFEIPKIKGHLEGNKTVVSNLTQIATTLGRKVELIVKYIEKNLATKARIEGTFIIFNTKLSAVKLNERVQQFADQFVICKECSKPDTKLSKDSGIYFVRCSACGAKYSINSKI
jgi:translation initiation factor 2 subunit 2